MSSIFSSATPESPHTSPLSPVERAALRVAESAAISPAGFRDLTQAIVLELQAAGLLVAPADRSTDTEYECPSCNRWAGWTDGRSIAAGELADEFWCQSCGAVVNLTTCKSRQVTAVDAQAEVSPWQRATDGLNGLVDAGIGFHIEPDGHISHPAGDEHIEWDHAAERWRLVHDEEPTPPCRHVSPYGRTCDYDKGHIGDHGMSDGLGGHFGWPVEEPTHPAPCRWPASPSCTCGEKAGA